MYLVIISLFLCHLKTLYQFFTNPLMAMFQNKNKTFICFLYDQK